MAQLLWTTTDFRKNKRNCSNYDTEYFQAHIRRQQALQLNQAIQSGGFHSPSQNMNNQQQSPSQQYYRVEEEYAHDQYGRPIPSKRTLVYPITSQQSFQEKQLMSTNNYFQNSQQQQPISGQPLEETYIVKGEDGQEYLIREQKTIQKIPSSQQLYGKQSSDFSKCQFFSQSKFQNSAQQQKQQQSEYGRKSGELLDKIRNSQQIESPKYRKKSDYPMNINNSISKNVVTETQEDFLKPQNKFQQGRTMGSFGKSQQRSQSQTGIRRKNQNTQIEDQASQTYHNFPKTQQPSYGTVHNFNSHQLRAQEKKLKVHCDDLERQLKVANSMYNQVKGELQQFQENSQEFQQYVEGRKMLKQYVQAKNQKPMNPETAFELGNKIQQYIKTLNRGETLSQWANEKSRMQEYLGDVRVNSRHGYKPDKTRP